jgi:5-methylcytosine-specific restriction endonuclease McrBC GTP-binding regulatory subunit McrB
MNLYTDFWKRTLRQIVNQVDPVKPADFDLTVDELRSIGDRSVSGYNGKLVMWAGKIEHYKDSAVFRSLKALIESTSQWRNSLPGEVILKIYANSTLKVTYQPITFETIIHRYRTDISTERKESEIYKWKLVKSFQLSWDSYEKGENSFKAFFAAIDFKNLVFHNAIWTLKKTAAEKPVEFEKVLLKLFDEKVSLEERIKVYVKEFEELFYSFHTGGYKASQDDRTIATLLTFRHPDKYTLFKDSFYSKLSKAFGIKPAGTGEKLFHYYPLVKDLIENHLINHPDIIAFKNSMIDEHCYSDTANLLLAQDILYLTLDSDEESEIDKEKAFETEPEDNPTTKQHTTMIPLNHILYGPPGTGKTYCTIDKALEIVDEPFYLKNKDNRSALTSRFKELLINDWNTTSGQIAFVTFHQNMSYEDFIEGIKPDLSGNDQEISYTVEPGIFKKISALAATRISVDDNFDLVYEKLLQEIEENGNSLILKTPMKSKPFTTYVNSKQNLRFHANTEKAYEGVIKKNFISAYLQTGELTEWPSYTKAVGDYIKSRYGYTSSQKSEDKNYVLIIDEINRGNISQIFGELITLIEDDKRQGSVEELTVTLPYSKKPFSVPANLYIIGTMNTADRSVEALDSALRRRFVFEHKPPQPELLNMNKTPALSFTDINFEKLLIYINNRIEKLLSKDYQIGHAYLINIKSMDDLRMVFRSKIIPLLQEYFFGDHGRIGLVIGEVFIKNQQPDQPVNLLPVSGYDTGDLNSVKIYQVQDIMQWKEDDFIKNVKAIYGE